MKIITVILLVFCMISCSLQKNIVSSSLPLNKELPKEVYYSLNFKQFWLDLVSETETFKKMSKYSPSKEMREEYSLVKQGDQYVISGFLKVNAEFDKDNFKSFGGTLVKFTETQYTFTFPIVNIDKIFSVEGISAVELANKVQIK